MPIARAFFVGGKGPPEHGKAVGQDHSFAQTLQEAAADEQREARRESNRGRAQAVETIPARNIRFCPNRSPRAPPTKVRAASGRSSAFMTHCRSSGDRRMSRPIAASATVTTAPLTNTRQLPRLDAASTLVLPRAPTA